MIPRDWDLRKTLTPGQKSWITKQAAKFAQVIEKPKNFDSRVYSEAKTKRLKDAGFFGFGRNIIVPNFGDRTQRTYVLEDSVVIHRTLPAKHGKPYRVTERVYLHSGPKLLNVLSKRFAEDLPRGEYWALKVGDNHTFINNHEKNLSQLMRYGQRIFSGQLEPGDKGFTGDREWAVHRVHLVKFRYDDGEDHSGAGGQLPYNESNPTEYKGRKPPARKKKWANKRGK